MSMRTAGVTDRHKFVFLELLSELKPLILELIENDTKKLHDSGDNVSKEHSILPGKVGILENK